SRTYRGAWCFITRLPTSPQPVRRCGSSRGGMPPKPPLGGTSPRSRPHVTALLGVLPHDGDLVRVEVREDDIELSRDGDGLLLMAGGDCGRDLGRRGGDLHERHGAADHLAGLKVRLHAVVLAGTQIGYASFQCAKPILG